MHPRSAPHRSSARRIAAVPGASRRQTHMRVALTPPAELRARRALTAFLALYGILCLAHPDRYGLLDSVDLAIHEMGHLVFGPFGEFVGFAGGTLMQLLTPAAFVVYFARRADRHAATVALWWVAQNLWNVSVYVRDARSQDLPLVGGGEHDWAYLLGETGLLAHDQAIGRAVHALGVVVFVCAIALGWRQAGEESRGERLASSA